MKLKSWAVSLTLLLAAGVVAQPVPAYQNQQSEADSSSSPASASSGNAALYDMIQQLQQEVRQLNGQLEEQQHRLSQLEAQSKSRYIDLDQRILDLNKKIGGITSAAASGAGGTTSGPSPSAPAGASSNSSPAQQGQGHQGHYAPPSPAEKKDYEAIRGLIEAKKYDQAIDRLFRFLSKYPKGDLTVNAYYWLGEVYLVQGQLEQAQQAFTIVSTRYSDHRKAPDALYKLAVIQQRQKKVKDAENTLQQVISTYPESHAAGLAKKDLASLKSKN